MMGRYSSVFVLSIVLILGGSVIREISGTVYIIMSIIYIQRGAQVGVVISTITSIVRYISGTVYILS